MNELKTIHNAINTLWTLIKKHDEQPFGSDEEWEAFMDEGHELSEQIEDQRIKSMFCRWLVAYMDYKEEKDVKNPRNE